MRGRIRWHRTITIALAVAFVCAVLVHRHEVTLLTLASRVPDETPVGWLAVFVAAALSFICGASFTAAAYRGATRARESEDLG